MAKKGILPPILKMIVNKYYPLRAHPSPVFLQHSEISSCSKSMLCTEPESLGDNQTESASLGGQADGRKGEQLETSFTVHPMT